ncbi:MAG: hypothetical protein ABSF90_17500 [Syntrophobacteraceae bacterium]|jgi:hypothetical protein
MAQDPLRIWQLATSFPEPPPYTREKFALDRSKAILRIAYPDPQFKLYGIVSKSGQQAGGVDNLII